MGDPALDLDPFSAHFRGSFQLESDGRYQRAFPSSHGRRGCDVTLAR